MHYVHQWTMLTLVLIMDFCFNSTKPLSEPQLPYCQLVPRVHISVKSYLKIKSFHSTKCIWNAFCKMVAILSQPQCVKLLWFACNWWSLVGFKTAYEILNLRALKISTLCKDCFFQCMGEIFCVEFQSYPLKFLTKYLTQTSKDVHFIRRWKFKFESS